MKAILMSIRPQWVAKILNGEKTIEIRKKFPSDYVGWVYIYCTKGNKNECLIADLQPDKVYHPLTEKLHRGVYSIVEEKAIWNDCKKYILNGKVVARFWCDKVEEQPADRPIEGYVFEQGCLTSYDILNYCGYKTFYAIHITKLEIFDKPKEIKNFLIYSHTVAGVGLDGKDKTFEILKPLTKAPQSYCFIRDVL